MEQWEVFEEEVKHREDEIPPTHTQLEETDDSRQGTFQDVRDYNTEQDLNSIVYQNQSPERLELNDIIINLQIDKPPNLAIGLPSVKPKKIKFKKWDGVRKYF